MWRRVAGLLCWAAICVPAAAHAQSAASPFTSATRYDAARRIAGTIAPDPDGTGPLHHAATRAWYDAAGRVIRIEEGELAAWQSEAVLPENWTGFTIFSQVDTTYDAMNRKIVERVWAAGVNHAVTQYSYDAMGRPECTAVRMNPAVFASLPASACSLGTQGSQGPDRITRNVYDIAGQLLQVRKAVGTSLEQAYATYSYTPNGRQEHVVDANGNKARLVYDGFDRQTGWYFPSTVKPTAYNPSTPANALATSGAVSTTDYEAYGYDANGNRTSFRKRDGRTFTYAYDALNRVTSKIVPDACVSGYACTNVPASATRDVYYSYDLRGLQTAARFDSASGADAVTSGYDGFGRLTSSTTSMGGVSRTLGHSYDADGNRTRVTHPDGAYFAYTYDGLDRMLHADWWGSTSGTVPFMQITYDAQGQRSDINRASSYTGYGYDGVSRLTSQSQRFAGNAGNLNVTFGYNPASQITSRTRSDTAYGFTGYVGVNRSYATNGLNQYNSAGGVSFGYDANGNLTASGSTAYTYDAENRLVVASTGANLVYDPLGRLYQTSGGAAGITRFLYDGDKLTAEYNSSGTLLRRYMFGPGEDEPILWDEGSALNCSGTKVLHTDHQGSVIATADCWGNRTAINSYDEYGIPGSANAGRFQYTGQAWIPELGMYHYKARIYSPTLGRFLQTDPIGYDDQVNLYAYVGNDPVNSTDPTGEMGCCRRPPRPYQSLAGYQARAQAVSAQRTLRQAVPGYKNRPSMSSPNPTAAAYRTQLAIGQADYQALSIVGFGALNNQSRTGEGLGNSHRAVGRIQTAFQGVAFQRVSSPGTYNFHGGTGGLQAAEAFAQRLGATQTGSTGTGSLYDLSGLPSGTRGTVATYQSGNGYARATVTLTTTVTETGSRIPVQVRNDFKVRFDD